MQYIHTVCGGLIDTKTKTCTRCHKHWNGLTWWLTATEIRPIPEKQDRPKGIPYRRDTGIKTQYASWGNKVPGVGTIASGLPNWPRWARVVATVVVVGVVVFLLWRFL